MIAIDLNKTVLISKFNVKIFSNAMADGLRSHTSRLSFISTQNLLSVSLVIPYRLSF
jgi:hypothetical protein